MSIITKDDILAVEMLHLHNLGKSTLIDSSQVAYDWQIPQNTKKEIALVGHGIYIKTGSRLQWKRLASTYNDLADRSERTKQAAKNHPAYEYVKSLVLQRITYGYRTEVKTSRTCYTLAWSNGSASWWVGYVRQKSVDLDANEILVCGIDKFSLELIAIALPPLPLYGQSFEYDKIRKFQQ